MSEKKEYIKRGALIAFVRGVRKNLPKDSKDFFTRDEMLLNLQQYVELQPAADVEPVVRCGKCRFGSPYNGGICKCTVTGSDHTVDFFCAIGAHMDERSDA